MLQFDGCKFGLIFMFSKSVVRKDVWIEVYTSYCFGSMSFANRGWCTYFRNVNKFLTLFGQVGT